MISDLTQRFSIDGVELAWDRWGTPGDRPPLLLCHGFSGSSHDFALVIEELATECEVITIDHRGHGLSTKLGTTDGYSLDRIVEDLVAFVTREIGGPVDLLGHSMGGAISLRFTLNRPDLVRSLVLMDTSAWSFKAADADMAALMTAFLAGFDPATGLPDMSAVEGPETPLIAATTPAEWQARKEVMAASFDPWAMKALGLDLWSDEVSVRHRLGEIRCPATVIVGELDEPFASQAPDLAAEVTDGRLTIIDGAYHSPQLTHRAEWLAALRAHLTR